MKERFEGGEFGRYILLGDAGYAVHNYLLTPLRNPETAQEVAYNRSHKKTRNVVERCFGCWKGQFRCLTKCIGTNLRTAKCIIVASAVLHNLSVMWKEEIEDVYLEEEEEENGARHNEIVVEERGQLFRQHFIEHNF